MRRRLFTLTATVLLVVTPAWSLSGCGGAGGPVIGDILGGLTNNVDSIIQNAGAEARATTLAAAAAVQDAINNAEAAFAADLNKSIDKVDETVQGDINRLQAMVAGLQQGTQEALKAATADAQQLLNTLPFTNRNPQVTRYSPVFVTQGGAPSMNVRIQGNFVYAQQQGKIPTLKVGGQTFQPTLNTTQELGFTVPVGLLPRPPARQLGSVSMELDAPYEKGAIFKQKDLSTYRLLVNVLPDSPVNKLTLTNQVTTKGTASQELLAPVGAPDTNWSVNSYDCLDHTLTQSVAASPGGWKIVPSSAENVVTFNKNPGSADFSLNGFESSIVTKGHTRPACFLGICNGCGSISWYLKYRETRDWEATADQDTPLSLRWGDRLNVPVTKNRWRLSAELFDGRTYQVATTDTSGPYLSVQDLGSSISIQTPATDSFFAQ